MNSTQPVANRRIAMYGGAFDPVHLTHLELARCVTQALHLEQLLWVPTGDAWHKNHVLTAAQHRVAMLKLAFQDEPEALVQKWVISTSEIDRTGPSYTVDTLEQLQQGSPDAQWYVVMGADQFALFHTWKRWQEIASRCTLAVIGRAGIPLQADANVMDQAKWVHVPFAESDVSSSVIRELAHQAAGGSQQAAEQLAGMVPAPVIGYIEKHHLYQ